MSGTMLMLYINISLILRVLERGLNLPIGARGEKQAQDGWVRSPMCELRSQRLRVVLCPQKLSPLWMVKGFPEV